MTLGVYRDRILDESGKAASHDARGLPYLTLADARIRLIDPGRVALDGRVGDLVTLLPVGADAVGVTTSGLAYPLSGEALYLGRSRGLSNRRIEARATVELESGRLLAVETPATLSR